MELTHLGLEASKCLQKPKRSCRVTNKIDTKKIVQNQNLIKSIRLRVFFMNIHFKHQIIIHLTNSQDFK